MKCKYCNQELKNGTTVCPECGKKTVNDKKNSQTISMSWQMLVGIIAAAVLLSALAVILLVGMGVDLFPDKPTEPTTVQNPNIGSYVSDVDYSGTMEEAINAANTVVATMNGKELTNGMLQIYFYMQVNDFVNYYYDYLSYIGFDYTKTLNTQQCYYDAEKSWEEYFVESAIKTWQNYQVVYMLAQEAEYKLPEDMQAQLDKISGDLETSAKQEGLESADALIKKSLGDNCSLEDYLEYCTLFYIDANFTDIEPSMDEIEKYYNDHVEEFEKNGITKESGPIVDVRHILLVPEGGVDVAEESDWEDCLKKAQDLLNEWKSGENPTEWTFAALAEEHSEDGGSKSNGGLYSGLTKDVNFVEPFLNWCIDEARQVGDTDIVKTEYGYHIMYFVKGQEQWIYYSTTQYMAERIEQMINDAKDKWPMEVDYSKLCVAEIDFS